MDGRDIGTMVFPQAELKIFCDASAEKRAERRFKELTEKGQSITYEEVRPMWSAVTTSTKQEMKARCVAPMTLSDSTIPK